MENNKKILYMFNPLCGQYMDNIVKSKALSDFLETEINLEKNPTMKPVFCIKNNCTAINLWKKSCGKTNLDSVIIIYTLYYI